MSRQFNLHADESMTVLSTDGNRVHVVMGQGLERVVVVTDANGDQCSLHQGQSCPVEPGDTIAATADATVRIDSELDQSKFLGAD